MAGPPGRTDEHVEDSVAQRRSNSKAADAGQPNEKDVAAAETAAHAEDQERVKGVPADRPAVGGKQTDGDEQAAPNGTTGDNAADKAGEHNDVESGTTGDGPSDKAPLSSAAPLDPPVEPAYHAVEKRGEHVSVPEAGIDTAGNRKASIIDVRTGETPDPDAMFERVTPQGTSYECKVRLVQRVFFGPHATPSEQLVLPQGAVVSEAKAEQLKALVRAESEADAAE